MMVIAWPGLHRSDPLVDNFPPFILSMHFFIGRIWDGGLKGLAVCLIFSTDTFSTVATVLCLVRFWWQQSRRVKPVWEAAVSLVPPASLPTSALFGPKLDTFSTKATIRDIGQFGTHCHRLPFTKLNLVQNQKYDFCQRILKKTHRRSEFGIKMVCLAQSCMMQHLMMWRWWRQWPTAASGSYPHQSQKW